MSGASDLLSMASARIKELEARLKFQDEWLSNGVYYTTDEAFKLHDDYNTKIAELTTKLAIQQTMPMKYKRMAFNAQLQKENDELTAKLDKSRKALILASMQLVNYSDEEECKPLKDMLIKEAKNLKVRDTTLLELIMEALQELDK